MRTLYNFYAIFSRTIECFNTKINDHFSSFEHCKIYNNRIILGYTLASSPGDLHLILEIFESAELKNSIVRLRGAHRRIIFVRDYVPPICHEHRQYKAFYYSFILTQQYLAVIIFLDFLFFHLFLVNRTASRAEEQNSILDIFISP